MIVLFVSNTLYLTRDRLLNALCLTQYEEVNLVLMVEASLVPKLRSILKQFAPQDISPHLTIGKGLIQWSRVKFIIYKIKVPNEVKDRFHLIHKLGYFPSKFSNLLETTHDLFPLSYLFLMTKQKITYGIGISTIYELKINNKRKMSLYDSPFNKIEEFHFLYIKDLGFIDMPGKEYINIFINTNKRNLIEEIIDRRCFNYVPKSKTDIKELNPSILDVDGLSLEYRKSLSEFYNYHRPISKKRSINSKTINLRIDQRIKSELILRLNPIYSAWIRLFPNSDEREVTESDETNPFDVTSASLTNSYLT